MNPLRAEFVSLTLAMTAAGFSTWGQAAPTSISIDANAPAHPFPHFWEQIFGSGHAVLALRGNYRKDLETVHDQIRASALPALPLLWTEWNVPSYVDLDARDNWYVGPALARDISQCDGSVKMMSWWTFDDVFEESGVTKEPFDGGFGLIASGMIKKPSSYDFSLLHQLGDVRLANSADNILVTRRKDGTLVVAAERRQGILHGLAS